MCDWIPPFGAGLPCRIFCFFLIEGKGGRQRPAVCQDGSTVRPL